MAKRRIMLGLVCVVLGLTGMVLAEQSHKSANAADVNNVNVAMQAFELRMAGRVDEAKVLLEKAVGENPQDANAWFELSRVCFYMAPETLELNSAQKAIGKAIKIDGQNARFHYLSGMVATYNGILKVHSVLNWPGVPGQFRKSIKALEKAVQLKPDYHKARRELIGYYQRLPWYLGGSKSKAKKHEEKIVALGGKLDEVPDPNMALLDFGLEYIREKKYELAKQKIQEYLETKPVVPMRAYGLSQLARICWLEGKKKEAEELKKQAEQFDRYYWPTAVPPPYDLFVAP